MTVKELIEQLQKLEEPDAIVCVEGEGFSCADEVVATDTTITIDYDPLDVEKAWRKFKIKLNTEPVTYRVAVIQALGGVTLEEMEYRRTTPNWQELLAEAERKSKEQV